ncbi:hypothetical protein J8273_8631 [Carpediemonas membranifera]|uniref:Uncharacterized protein n=1 Tax=Carpediemonas membranifera TaxID=201153 RepID=A0A8J6AXW8_9EUKA|nr:hypothetical protein J8273_8631 [Carpediemonas membranifera]|eukprot:KAG9389944.1 hypothetical protein J8273_8631 [Carpediemonas membranifera]
MPVQGGREYALHQLLQNIPVVSGGQIPDGLRALLMRENLPSPDGAMYPIRLPAHARRATPSRASGPDRTRIRGSVSFPGKTKPAIFVPPSSLSLETHRSILQPGAVFSNATPGPLTLNLTILRLHEDNWTGVGRLHIESPARIAFAPSHGVSYTGPVVMHFVSFHSTSFLTRLPNADFHYDLSMWGELWRSLDEDGPFPYMSHTSTGPKAEYNPAKSNFLFFITHPIENSEVPIFLYGLVDKRTGGLTVIPVASGTWDDEEQPDLLATLSQDPVLLRAGASGLLASELV